MRDVLTFILAGGKGERLDPLTRDRAKPAVPFGGIYRIIDFVLSNCVNSGLRRIFILTQYKSFSLQRHILLQHSSTVESYCWKEEKMQYLLKASMPDRYNPSTCAGANYDQVPAGNNPGTAFDGRNI